MPGSKDNCCNDPTRKRNLMQAEIAGRKHAPQLSPTEPRHTEEQLKDVFNLFDADRSGCIDSGEMRLLLKGMGYGNLAASVQYTQASLTFEEVKAIINQKVPAMDSEEEVAQAFSVFDYYGKGCIDAATLLNAVRSTDSSLSEAEVQDVLSWCDIDCDGVISLQDFKEVMNFIKLTDR